MRHNRLALVSRLLAPLVVFQFLAGVPLCREWTAGPRSLAGAAATAQASVPVDHGGGHGHHDHAAGGHVECPETFLPPAQQGPEARAAMGRTRAAPGERLSSPIHEVPTPVPIV